MGEEVKTVKIIDQTIIPSADPKRLGKKDLIITYQDEAMRVRVVTIPYEKIEGKSEEEQWETIQQTIRAAEQERRRFIGREIKL
mgnify:CR=1 FL=1